jgi:hypothetical protein
MKNPHTHSPTPPTKHTAHLVDSYPVAASMAEAQSPASAVSVAHNPEETAALYLVSEAGYQGPGVVVSPVSAVPVPCQAVEVSPV